MSFLEALALETAVEQASLFQIRQITDGLAGRLSHATYIAYLTQAFHHVRHTVPLMRLAQSRMDVAHASFARALDDYIAEETGHDQWILDDIANAGGDRDAAAASQPSAATEAMVTHAYSVVCEGNPMAFFGMVYVLEGASTALASRGASALGEALGLGPECFSYLTSHGELDQDHIAFFQRLMATVEDPDDQAAIIRMAKQMYGLFGDIFRGIPHDEGSTRAV